MLLGAEWITTEVSSRLIGVDPDLIRSRAKRGRYGPTQQRADGEILISTRGLELAGRCFFSQAQIAAAKAGKPLPPDFAAPFVITRKRRSVEEIGRIVLMTEHNGARS